MSGAPPKVVGNCSGKERFETAASAYKAVRGMHRHGKAVEHYACATCDGWHVGRRHGVTRRPDHKLISNGAAARPKRHKDRTRQIETEGAGA